MAVNPSNDTASHVQDSNTARKLDTVLEESGERTELESSGPFDVTLDDLPITFAKDLENLPKNSAQFSDNTTEVTGLDKETHSEKVESPGESEKVIQGMACTSSATDPTANVQQRSEAEERPVSDPENRQTPVSEASSRPEVEIILDSELQQVEHIQLSLIVESDSAQDSALESEPEINAESTGERQEVEIIVEEDESDNLPTEEQDNLPTKEQGKEDIEVSTQPENVQQENFPVAIMDPELENIPVAIIEPEQVKDGAQPVSHVENSPASESSVEIPDESGDGSVFATPGQPKNTSVSDQSVSLDEDYYDSDTPNCSYHTPRSRAHSPVLKLSMPQGKQSQIEDLKEPEVVDLTGSDVHPEPMGSPPPPYLESKIPEVVDLAGDQSDSLEVIPSDGKEKSEEKSQGDDANEQESLTGKTTKSIAVATDFPSTDDTEDDEQSDDQEISEREVIEEEVGEISVGQDNREEIEVVAVLPATPTPSQEVPALPVSSEGDRIEQSGQSTASSVLQPLDDDYIDRESDGFVDDSSSDDECEILQIRLTPSQPETKNPEHEQVEPDQPSVQVESDKYESHSAADLPPSDVAIARLDRLEAILVAEAEALQSPASSVCAGDEPLTQSSEREVEGNVSQNNAEREDKDSEISSSAPGPLTSSQVVSEGSFNSEQTLTSEYVEPLRNVAERASEDDDSSSNIEAAGENANQETSERSDLAPSSSQEAESATEDTSSADDEASTTSGMYPIHASDSLEYLPELPEEEEADVVPGEQEAAEQESGSAFEAKVSESEGAVSIHQVN